MAKLIDAPCYGCDRRHVGCHGDCLSYAAYNTRREAIRAERLREWDMENNINESARRGVRWWGKKWGANHD